MHQRGDSLPRRAFYAASSRMPFLLVTLLLAMASSASAQLSGTYTIGGAGANYASIEAALTALTTSGVNGAVTFRIANGTYTPPSGGYSLGAITGASVTNTITFKPATGATVLIAGNTSTGSAVFNISGGKYYIFDGSNAAGGTSKDMTIRQLQTSANPAIWLQNDADNNTIKNCIVQASASTSTKTSSTSGIGAIFIGITSAASGNDNNLIENCMVGDPNGVYRSNTGIGLYGTSTKPNTANKITGCEIINFGNASGSDAIGINAYAELSGTVIEDCEIHNTIPTSATTIYGIYTDYSPGFPVASTFDGNRIYSLLSAPGSVYGIYHWVSTATNTSTITNNMISLMPNGDYTVYGIYYASSSGTVNFSHNSINIGGTAPSTSTRLSYAMYKSGAVTINNRNNIFFSNRSGGSGLNYGLYVSSTTGWTSDFNLIDAASASNGRAAYYTAARTTLADYRSVYAGEVNSFTGEPRFIAPATGNLHISTTRRTPVESRGTPLATVTVDFDNNNRNGTTPDVGADEGTFTNVIGDDMAAELFITPINATTIKANTPISPIGLVYNNGTNSRTGVTVRYRIRNSSNTVVYEDVKTTGTMAGLAMQQITFSQTGSVTGSTSLSAGSYTIELRTELATDGDATNNVITGTLVVKAPLSGTYTINETGTGVTNFTSFTQALTELKLLGISGAVTFQVASGTYDGTTEVFPLKLTTFEGMSATNNVTFKAATGATILVDGSVGSAGIFDIDGGDYYVLDGANTVGGSTRNWKVINRADGQAVRLVNGATYNRITNMNLISGGSSSATGVVNIGTTTSAAAIGNSYNVIQRNTIGDSAGVIRTNSGVYMVTADATYRNTANLIDDNDIMNLGYPGGFIYGVYVNSNNNEVKIFRNRIRNTNITNTSGTYPNYGVYYTNSSNLNDTIAYNRIWNLNTEYPTATLSGIYFSSVGSSPVSVHNNMISLSAADGTIYGIYSSQTSTSTLNIYYNSINIGGSNTISTTSYNVYMSSSVNATLRNNVLTNERVSTGSGTNRLIHRPSTTGTFVSNNNLLYANGASTAVGLYSATTHSDIAAWRTGSGQDANSVGGNPRYVNEAAGDLHISTTIRTPLEGKGTPIAGIDKDFDGNTRNATTPDIGADEGPFLVLLPDNLAAEEFVLPLPGTIVRGNTAFNPVVIVTNVGTNPQTGAPVRFTIKNATTGAVVYEDVKTTGTLNEAISAPITFAQTGSVSGSTVLTPGTYAIEVRTQLNTDTDTTNNALYGTITVKSPLNGLYTINKNGSGARNYTSFTAALTDLNSAGVDAATTFEVAAGTYDATTESFPLTIAQTPGVSSANNVTFRPASGAVVAINGNTASPLIDVVGGDYITFNGNGSGTARNWKITNIGAGPVLRFVNGATYNTVKNMNLIGNSGTTANGIVTFGATLASIGVGNSHNLITANTLGDTTGAYRSNSAVYGSGDFTYPNIANTIDGNDVINFGYGASIGYAIYVASNNQLVKILRNKIRCTVLTGTSGLYPMYGIYYTNSNNQNDTIAYNQIWGLNTLYASTSMYGIYLSSVGSSPLTIHNNMIALSGVAANVYGIYVSSGTNVIADHNSIHIGGTATSTSTTAAVYVTGSPTLTLRNNVLVNQRIPSSGTNSFVIYKSSTTSTLNSDNNVLFASGTGTAIGYSASARADLAAWQGVGFDPNSKPGPVTFINPSIGDLHIDPQPIFRGEGIAQNLGYPMDYDQQARNPLATDIGADDGDFNGDGVRIVFPNGGEQLPVNYEMVVRYTVNRPMSVRFEISTNSGKTWAMTGPTMNATTGQNSVTISTPDTVLNTVRVRVVNARNQWEMDDSDGDFSLLRPVFTMLSPNGGEQWVPTDTMKVRWSSRFVPGNMTVDVEFSTDGGNTWSPIAQGITTNNLPGTNSIDWIVPNTATTRGLIRVRLPNSASRDSSDAFFTIVDQPGVNLIRPNGGENLFVGEKTTIRWTNTTTDYVRIEYSTDGGASWNEIVRRVPAYVDSLVWTVPNNPSTTVLVRVVNVERPRFNDQSDGVFAIIRGMLAVLTPNGGEKYELSQPVTATWSAPNSTSLRLDYSSNGGKTWETMISSVPAAQGSATFTPPAVPTRNAVVRLVDVDRNNLVDVSDGAFEIMEAPSIIVMTPTQGNELPAGSTTMITWSSNRIDRVTIDFSPNGGVSWTPVSGTIQAVPGSFTWSVPVAKTTQGKIRIREVGGPVIGETGLFSIVDPKNPIVQVIAPNGGENFTVGTEVPIQWTASDVDRVSAYYSDDAGQTWRLIQGNIPAKQGQISWVAPDRPGMEYRVRIVASPTVLDESDANFEISRKLAPALTVIYPNGGEALKVDETVNVRWAATDVNGNVTIEYSIDNGNAWKSIGSAPAGSGTYAWTVPNEPTTTALVRVSAGSVNDVSDATFEIAPKLVVRIRVLSPNGGEVWRVGEQHDVEWESEGVENVTIRYSTDGGANWSDMAASVPAALGKYSWTLPGIDSTVSALVRVTDVNDVSVTDISDAVFSIMPPISGVLDPAITGAGLRLMGNFPNPFASSTEIRWEQGASSDVMLRIYERSGRLLQELALGRREAGNQRVSFSAGSMPSGMYVYELLSGGNSARGMMMIVR